MLGHSILTSSINILILIGIMVLLQIISYFTTRPIIDMASIVTFAVLILVTYLPWGTLIAILIAGYTLYLPKVHKLYKFGIVAFLLALLLTFIVNHVVLFIRL